MCRRICVRAMKFHFVDNMDQVLQIALEHSLPEATEEAAALSPPPPAPAQPTARQ